MHTSRFRRSIFFLSNSLAFFFGISIHGVAQDSSESIVIGEQIQIYSEIMSEDRTILVGMPQSYGTGQENYPVLYVLDGGAHFHYTTGLTKFLAANQIIPEMIVVAIENTDRTRDLTPLSQNPREAQAMPTNGGADTFLQFINDELVPWVDEQYRTRPYRVLVGHSFGGLFAINALVTRPEMFNGYIAISPSLQWNDQRLVARAEAFFDDTPELAATLFMTAGNEGQGLLGGTRKLAGVLDQKAPRGFEWDFEHMPLEHHGSVPHRSTYQGLEFLFSDWYLRDPLSIYEDFGYDALEKFHANADRKYGYERGVPDSTVRLLVGPLALMGRIDEATAIVMRAQGPTPPASALLFLAGQYMGKEQNDKAAELYRLALNSNPASAPAQAALDKLGVDYSDLIPDAVSVSAAILNSYVGRYAVAGSIVELSLVDGKLSRALGGNKAELVPMSDTEFMMSVGDVSYSFDREADGSVNVINITQNGQPLVAVRVE